MTLVVFFPGVTDADDAADGPASSAKRIFDGVAWLI